MPFVLSRVWMPFFKPPSRGVLPARSGRIRPRLESLEGRELMAAAPVAMLPATSPALTLSTPMTASSGDDEIIGVETSESDTPDPFEDGPFEDQVDDEVVTLVVELGVDGFEVVRWAKEVIESDADDAPITIVGPTSDPMSTTDLARGDESSLITDLLTGLEYRDLYKVQLGRERLLLRPSATSDDWKIEARGVPIQLIGTARHDAGRDFPPNPPSVDLPEGAAKADGPGLAPVPGQGSHPAIVEVVGDDLQAGDTLEVDVSQVPNNLRDGVNVATGHGFTSDVVSEEDPGNLLDSNQSTHSMDPLFSETTTPPSSITPIDVIVRLASGPDITLHLNLVVQAVATTGEAPAAPANFKATPASASRINLSWTLDAGATGDSIDERIDNPWMVLGSVAAAGGGGPVTHLAGGTSVSFRRRVSPRILHSGPADADFIVETYGG